MHACTCVYACVTLCVCMNVCVFVFMYVCSLQVCTCLYTRSVCIYAHICMHDTRTWHVSMAKILSAPYARTQARTHARTHTNVHEVLYARARILTLSCAQLCYRCMHATQVDFENTVYLRSGTHTHTHTHKHTVSHSHTYTHADTRINTNANRHTNINTVALSFSLSHTHTYVTGSTSRTMHTPRSASSKKGNPLTLCWHNHTRI
jgi:hypothetical protein